MDASPDPSSPDKLEPGLYVTGTPIGNLEDLSARALRILTQVDLILAEDTRHTRRLLARYALRTPLASGIREASRRGMIRDRVERGEAIAYVTDAGMPGISDPGARTVAACRADGVPVFIVPGPSAVSATLALSGFPADRFTFLGFLPVKSGGRGKALAALAELDHTGVLFESPHRVLKLFDELVERVPDRMLFVGRELTKKFEEGVVGTPVEVREHFVQGTVKGEFVVVVAPPGWGVKPERAPPG